MDSNPTLNFFHKVSTFTTVQNMSKQLERVFAFTHKGGGKQIKDVAICYILDNQR